MCEVRAESCAPTIPQIHLKERWVTIKELVRAAAGDVPAAADSTDELLFHRSSSISVRLASVGEPKGADAGGDGLRVTIQTPQTIYSGGIYLNLSFFIFSFTLLTSGQTSNFIITFESPS